MGRDPDRRAGSTQAQRGLLLHIPFWEKRAAPGKNSEVESKPTSLREDPIHPKNVQNDSDVNIIIPELAGIFIQVQHTREFQLTLQWPEDVGWCNLLHSLGKPDSSELASQHPCVSCQLHQRTFLCRHLRNCKQLSEVFKAPTTFP